jgi:hypothetical protein
MNEKYLSSVEERIEKALANNMPFESRLIFVGELAAAVMSQVITINQEEKLLARLGFTRGELYKWTDYVTFGEPQ